MKLRSLISTVLLGATVLVQAQTEDPGPFLLVEAETVPTVQAQIPDVSQRAAARKPRVDADGTLHLSAGPLVEVVAQIELCLPDLNRQGSTDWSMPNVIYDEETGTRDADVPANLRLRKVSPVQALALVAAAAGCTLEAIFAPEGVKVEAGADSTAAASLPVIGYRIVQAPNADITGIGVTLVSENGKVVIGEVLPGSPADRSRHIKPGDRLLSVGEPGSDYVFIEGLPLQKVTELLRGTPGTPVHLKLQSDRSGGPFVVDAGLVREKLNPAALKPWSRGKVPVKIVDPASEAMMSAPGTSDSVPASSNPYGTRALSPEESNRIIVRVYATGSVFSGDEREAVVKQKNFEKLIGEALDHAGVAGDKVLPLLSFHTKSRALIVKATAGKHEIIQQVITALKENETKQAVTEEALGAK